MLRYRGRARLGRQLPPRVVPRARAQADRLILHPAIQVTPGSADSLRSQTESSWAADSRQPPPPFVLATDSETTIEPPPSGLEGLLLALAAEPLPWATAGPWTLLARDVEATSRRVVGRRLPLVPGHRNRSAAELARDGYVVRDDQPPGALIPLEVQPVDQALRALPPIDGPPTVLFVVPYLAIGGAERLLLDLIRGFPPDEVRALVVCLEPHAAERGQTLSEAWKASPWIFPLGDWLPREARIPALRHLLRRYRVETLFSWNPTTDLFDRLAELRRDVPGLRLLSQLFNHEGGWMDHYPQVLAADVDLHVAINRQIEAVWAERFQISADRITCIHHAVSLPPPLAEPERLERRRERRQQLGIPESALVVGSFLRLHPQKRPLDILTVARRFSASDDSQSGTVYFLLAGDGPSSARVDAELERQPLPNLIRLPMQEDPEPLFDALDLCLMTSAYEGLPVFLLEGMARELPVVAPAVGDVPLLLADGGGTVVPRPGVIDDYVEAIRSYRDPAVRHPAGRVARLRIEKDFSLPRYVDRYRRAIFGPTESEGGPS